MADGDEQRRRLAEIRMDFEVQYRFLSVEEGGRRTGPPDQGYRSDWSYEGDDIDKVGLYMMWPIFLNDDRTIAGPGFFVKAEGIAQMFIVAGERRSFHASTLAIGVRGYLMEGHIRVAEAVVTRSLSISDVANLDS